MSLFVHPATVTHLASIVASPPHALLLVAPAGAGKRSIARQLVADLLGVQLDALDNTAELLLLQPDKAEAYGIDSVRQAQHFMTRKTSGKTAGAVQRIVLIADAQNMTREAQNAILKLLEEPPAGSMLLLTATSPQALLSTIISRCQVLQLQKPTTEALTAGLVSRGHDTAAVALALRISDGWPGLAVAMLDPTAEHPYLAATAQARTLLQQTTFERLALVDALAKKRDLCSDTCYILQQMAHLALQSAKPDAVKRWERVLTASYACQEALQARVNAKLAMTQLMLAL